MKTTISAFSTPPNRRRLTAAFLIETAENLETPPPIKYSSLSLFFDKFFPMITSPSFHNNHYLLQNPLNFATLQLFSLISIWISAKFHDSQKMTLKNLKSIGDCCIKDQHFTKTDYLSAEILFLQCVGFDIGTMRNSVFVMVEELLMKFKEVARVGELVKFEACLDVLDLVYESEGISRLFMENAACLAAAVVVVAFVVTVPKQRCEFPVVGWVNFVTGCREEDVIWVVRVVLDHVVGNGSGQS